MNDRTELSKRMHALADTGHPRAAELREKADSFDVGAIGFYSEPQTVNVAQLMGRYARARKLWCEITGERLV